MKEHETKNKYRTRTPLPRCAACPVYCKRISVLIEDTIITDKKRWVVIAPQKGSRFKLLLAQPKNEHETKAIGNQTGGRVFLFLNTDNISGDKILDFNSLNFFTLFNSL